MNNFFTSALLGLSISIPVGTVTIQMMKQGLRNGFLYGWMVGLGGMTFDLLMIMLIYFGFSTYLNLPAVQQVMWLIGCLFLLYLSIDSFKESRRKKEMDGEPNSRSIKKSYLSGLLAAISPSNIVFWIGVFGTVLAASFEQSTTPFGFLTAAAGILAGILLHDVSLMGFVHYTRRFVSETFLRWFSITAGCLLLGFSFYFGYQFFQAVFS
ncbi:LysE family translocator [Paenibacillus pinihumi]|uniref:LysE family translocator n=1 Tax=Paenibacillus pinihumi TaxID=669462 RepID=UPI00041702C4|nr:LysE family transporter [Paenibacillus pinihumi]